jgi:inner membrane protein
MTGRTHDLAAFTALNFVLVTQPLSKMTLATALVAFSMNMVGGLAPDLDQPTSGLYSKVRAGSLIGKIMYPLFGGHRFISHSLLGIVLFGVGLDFILGIVGKVLLVDMEVVWWAFMIGFVSHIIMDLFTRDGVPLLFPIPIKFGFPPLRALRMATGGIVEKSFIFPALLLINGYLIYAHYQKILEFLKDYLK